FIWNDAVQSSPGSDIDFSFLDSLLSSLPQGLDALVVVDGLPSWMSNPANWDTGNPRLTLANHLIRQMGRRFGNHPKIVGFEIWNEPNIQNSQNETLGVLSSAENYVEMLAAASSILRELAPGKLILNAATTAINQNFPATLNYNKAMRDAGAQAFIDRYNIHYYGRQYERVTTGGGVADFLNGIAEPIWITESGIQGVNQQLEYGEQTWPFLRDNIPGIERIYIYRFADSSPPAASYGLRTLDPQAPVSDLYIHLRERAQ
ncbi:MAG: cellulase family glycosylhydrolase, partial [Bdellovibrionales bacterium]|nr:cellulase family glycosylhydrolase [Bdellovibrionales bacterium]